MKKRWLCGLLGLAMVLGATPAFAGQTSYVLQTPLSYDVTRDTRNIDGSVFLTLEALQESFPTNTFTKTDKTLCIENSSRRLTYTLADGKMELYTKGGQETMEKPNGKAAVVENGTTYYPLRDLMEAMNYSVGYVVEYSGDDVQIIVPVEQGKDVKEQQNLYAPFYLKLINGLSNTENEVISPYGLLHVMGMMASGAQGETREELLEAIGAESVFELEQYITSYEEYVRQMQTSKWGTVHLLDALVYQTGEGTERTILPDYASYLTETYEASIFGIDRPETFDAWLAEKTNGMITESGFAENFENFDVSFTSTLYLDLPWEEKFGVEDTKDGTFDQADGTKAIVPYLRKTMHKADYYQGNGKEAVILPYKTQAGKFSMVLVSTTDPLTLEEFQQITQEAENRYVELKLPKFQANNQVDLKEKMGQMGVTKAFGEEADFSLVSDTPLSLSCLLQSVAIDVNEEGTTAAAFTEATVYRSIVEDVVTVTFDHPFTYYIYEETSGQVLFAGKMNQAE